MALLSAQKSFLTDERWLGLYVYNLALIYAFYSLLDLIHSHCQTVES